MHIGWVGGVERNEGDLVRMAKGAGHDLTFHAGKLAGRGGQDLKSLVERADLVIILTDVNSHGGVIAAKRLARQYGKGTVVTRRLGAARFAAFLDALDHASPLLATGT
ncbi:MAG TPA: DUF2325 domain-containing protein [Byssovorax sp.]|jgi:hypothetical protein